MRMNFVDWHDPSAMRLPERFADPDRQERAMGFISLTLSRISHVCELAPPLSLDGRVMASSLWFGGILWIAEALPRGQTMPRCNSPNVSRALGVGKLDLLPRPCHVMHLGLVCVFVPPFSLDGRAVAQYMIKNRPPSHSLAYFNLKTMICCLRLQIPRTS